MATVLARHGHTSRPQARVLQVVRTLSENDSVGLDDFAASMERLVRHTARSLTYSDVMTLSTSELSAALEHDAALRIKAEAVRLKAEAQQQENGAAGAEKKPLAACFRKAGTIAKMSGAFRGRQENSVQRSSTCAMNAPDTTPIPENATSEAVEPIRESSGNESTKDAAA